MSPVHSVDKSSSTYAGQHQQLHFHKDPIIVRYLLQATLIASIPVEAETRVHAEQKLRNALAAAEANLGMLDDEPIVVAVEIEGELDLIDSEVSAGSDSHHGCCLGAQNRS